MFSDPSHVRTRRTSLIRGAALALLLCAGGTGWAQSLPAVTTWRMATEYPASAMPGEGLATFSDELKARSGGAVVVTPSFDASAGFKSAQIPLAVKEGKLEGGDAFGGALGAVDPLFLLSSLPFVATSPDAAKRLAELARADYTRAFAAQGQRLLYVTPWPATGLWSRKAVATRDDLRALSVRTYDDTSTDVMRAAGAKATNLSFADAMPRLKDGSVDAVLSSGDGGAGRKLWDYLPNFTAIGYAMPLSFTTVSTAAYNALTPGQRAAVDAAAQATEQKQWTRLGTRLAENAQRMQVNGVSVQEHPAADVQSALRDASKTAITAWRSRVGVERAGVLDAFQRNEK